MLGAIRVFQRRHPRGEGQCGIDYLCEGVMGGWWLLAGRGGAPGQQDGDRQVAITHHFFGAQEGMN
jgi:hypothetical protein